MPTWKKISEESVKQIFQYLIDHNGKVIEIKDLKISWRIQFFDVIITCYNYNTIFGTDSKSKNTEVRKAYEYIDNNMKSTYIKTDKEYVIGLDETGKGEVVGNIVLAGVVFPTNLFDKISVCIGGADTKKRHNFKFWDDIYLRLNNYISVGFDSIIIKIPPSEVDRYNINKLMDITYQRILNQFMRKVDISKCRIVVDNYKIGTKLKSFLDLLQKMGAEIIVITQSEDIYLETKVASLLSKREREREVESINNDQNYLADGKSIGTGNLNDSQTINWLNVWYESKKDWPWFIKKSYKTIKEIEGNKEKTTKEMPDLDESLLSAEFEQEFDKGNLSIKALSILCPKCKKTTKSFQYIIDKGKKMMCCDEFIDPEELKPILKYYCGYILPDSNIIRSGLLSKDLESNRFFEGFIFIITPIVRKECDNPGGKSELDRLVKIANEGRIKIETPGKVEEIGDNLSNIIRDEMILDDALKYNAILITRDKGMKLNAMGKNIFYITM
ncbi:MAG: hypothetical protein KA120_00470 [Candidatus Goldbacteria bacterium]|nr:hypothetical protein [Candidatus Goldiibacteriota bacterium]